LGKPGRDLVLDLSGVPTIDSTGVSILTRCHVQTQRQNRQCFIVGAQPSVHQVFDSMNLSSVLSFADTLEEAKRMKDPAKSRGGNSGSRGGCKAREKGTADKQRWA
jgi:anti-anti-sigma regulatory factor